MPVLPTAENAANVIIDKHGIELGKERTRLDWGVLRRCYDLGKPFWISREGIVAWVILGFTLIVTGLQSGTISWQLALRREMVDNAIAKHVPAFWHYFILTTAMQGILALLLTIQGPLVNLLQLWWRRSLTRQVLSDYLGHRAYYRINQAASVDNPDQRISDDVKLTVTQLFGIYIWISLIVSRLVVYLPYTWYYAGPRAFFVLSIAGAASLIFPKLFAYFVPYDNAQYKAEADFRFGLVRLRENSESVAFYQGEHAEHTSLMGRFEKIFRISAFLIFRTLWLQGTSQVYYTILGVLPVLLLYPSFFAGHLDYGTLMNVTQVVGAELDFLAVGLLFFNEWLGVAVTVNRLWNLIDKTKHERAVTADTNAFLTETDDRIAVRHLNFGTPDGTRTLAENVTFDVTPGKSLLVSGPSGSGKSALLRVIAGLWTPTSGEILRPPLRDLAFLPQKPYMPLGDLRAQLLYPQVWREDPDDSDAQLLAVLHEVGADYLVGQYGGLSAGADWAEVLSLGEQQMIAFARLILARVRFALLDEATSGLPEASEQRLYDKLKGLGITFISVAHRASLYPYHEKQLIFKGRATWEVANS